MECYQLQWKVMQCQLDRYAFCAQNKLCFTVWSVDLSFITALAASASNMRKLISFTLLRNERYIERTIAYAMTGTARMPIWRA